MVEIKNNSISMTRGDTLIVTVQMKKNRETYTPDPEDVIRFAMSRNYKGEKKYELLINKPIPSDTLILRLEPEDTEDIPYGTYNYDVELTDKYGIVDTFISSKITLTGEAE